MGEWKPLVREMAELIDGIELDWMGHEYETLEALRKIRDTADDAIVQAVDRFAFQLGWEKIARALGTTTLEAERRYRR